MYNAFWFASLYRLVNICGLGQEQPDVALVTQEFLASAKKAFCWQLFVLRTLCSHVLSKHYLLLVESRVLLAGVALGLTGTESLTLCSCCLPE